MLLLENLRQFDVALADFGITLGACGLLLYLVLAALCAPFVGVLTESAYTVRRKVFYDKCALQITQAGAIVAALLFFFVGGGIAALFYLHHPELFTRPLHWTPIRPYAIPYAPFLAALLLLFLYWLTWNPLKKLRFLHLPLGFFCALLCLALLFTVFLLLGTVQEPFLTLIIWTAPLSVMQALLLDFLDSPTLWLSALYILAFGLAACGSLSQLWLIARREKADYGRDYYAFAMRYCARLALFFSFAATALAGTIFWRLRESLPPELFQPLDTGIVLIAGGLPLSCCLIWLCMIKSDTPLRHKAGASFAFFFLFVALCAHLMLFFSTFPMM